MDIPPEVEILKDDLYWTCYYFSQYNKLYMHSEFRIDLLNEVAPVFFNVVQNMFWDEMILRLARLTDSPEKGKDKNLSIYILRQLALENKWDFASEIEVFLEEIKEISKSVRKHRNKFLGHRDLPTAMSKVVRDPDLIVTLDQTDKILKVIGKAINLIYGNFAKPIQSWIFSSDYDADDLIHYLKLAIIYKDVSKEENDWKKEYELSRNSRYFNA